MRPRIAALPLATAVVGLAAFAPSADAAYRCGSSDLPFTDGRAQVKVVKGSPGCRNARSLVVTTWKPTFELQVRSILINRGGRPYRCSIDANRTRITCSSRKNGRLRARVRATVV